MKKSIILYFIIGIETVLITFLLVKYIKMNNQEITTEVTVDKPGVNILSGEPESLPLITAVSVAAETTMPETTVSSAALSNTAVTSVSVTGDTEEQTETAEKSDCSEKIIIHDNGNRTVEYPYIDAPLNSYDFNGLQTDERKRKMYYENGEKKAMFGIDVSQYQGNVDWNRVREDGVEFVIARAGYRGYETGLLNADKKFLEYAQGVRDAGMKFGIYYYSQAINAQEAAEEAKYVLDLIESNNITVDMPVVYDWEYVQDEDPARTDDIGRETLNECAEAFCSVIQENGYQTLYYTNIQEALFRYDMNRLSKYGMWLAEYSASTDFIYDFKMWQYSCSGLIDGIESLVDLNLWFTE